ncbi:Ty1/Copia family ribonuclease HI [bacterium]|nr:Ty1/Copia family ribonuclease HI [bacterium]
MKILYGARAARWDLLKITQLLATRVTKWSKECDKALHRLVCYIEASKSHCLSGFVGDPPEKWQLRLYCDADFAGDRPDFKSTSGAYLALTGPNTFCPLAAAAKKQTAVSHSTPEAEICSAYEGMSKLGIPALDLWDFVLKRSTVLNMIEDNETTCAIIKSGKNPSMRHISRTHGVNIGWLHDLYRRQLFGLTYSRTEAMCADIFTKTFRELPKWLHAIKLIGIRPSGTLPAAPPEPGPRPETEQRKAEHLENLRNGGGKSKNSKKGQKVAAPAVCQHIDDWKDTSSRNADWPDFASHMKWKGTTAFETGHGEWVEFDHSHKWTNVLRTPEHFRKHSNISGITFTGKRRTTLHEWKKCDC